MAEIGQRIRELRDGWLTQQELATAADVSVDLIRKLEQGQRHTASVPSLQALASALDVDPATLLGRPTPAPTGEADEGIQPLRRVLTAVDDLTGIEPETEPMELAEAERTADYVWGAYWGGRYQLLAELLPSVISGLEATARTYPCERARRALARGYQVAGDTLAHMGHPDTAYLAIRRALTVAEASGDALLHTAMRVSVSWQMLVQGRYGDSTHVASRAAREIAPADSPSELSAYGLLTVTAATAAVRDVKPEESRDLLAEASEAARLLGHERSDHQSTFGPAKVAMLAVDCAVVNDDYTGALDRAKQLPRDAPLPLASRARHLADVALSHLRLDNDQRALDTLLTAEKMAPEWMRFQTLPRLVTRELLDRETRRWTPLREFAGRLGVSR